MLRGLAYVLMATALFGFAYAGPLFVPTFSPVELSIGRFTVYGCWSVILSIVVQWKTNRSLPIEHWRTALVFSVAGFVGYYILLVLAIRLLGASLATLIGGLLPIAISLYGNVHDRTFPFSVLMPPLAIIFFGITMIHIETLSLAGTNRGFDTLVGLVAILASIILWAWFAVANGRFLHKHREVRSADWSTLIGIFCLPTSLVIGGLVVLFCHDDLRFLAGPCSTSELVGYVATCLLLGIGSCWVTMVLWNRASVVVPMAIMGQMIAFEIVFGLLYIYLAEGRFPSMVEGCGIACTLAGIAFGFQRLFAQSRGSRARGQT